MPADKPRVAVLYLLRKANGEKPVQAFLESYKRFSAGLEHELIFLCKGFNREAELEPYQVLLQEVPHTCLLVSDRGFDIHAYFTAARQMPHQYVCFLNSFTCILTPDWLAFLYEHIQKPALGAAGATGSWESLYHNLLLQRRHQRWSSPLARLIWPLKVIMARRLFHGFPNPHLRTTGFICRREIFVGLKPPPPWTKFNAITFESGLNSMSQQMRRQGLEVAVVNRDNQSFFWKEWPRSGTFRLGQQEKLLLADNRTRQFAESPPEERCWLSLLAWGEAAGIDSMPGKI